MVVVAAHRQCRSGKNVDHGRHFRPRTSAAELLSISLSLSLATLETSGMSAFGARAFKGQRRMLLLSDAKAITGKNIFVSIERNSYVTETFSIQARDPIIPTTVEPRVTYFSIYVLSIYLLIFLDPLLYIRT